MSYKLNPSCLELDHRNISCLESAAEVSQGKVFQGALPVAEACNVIVAVINVKLIL